MHQAVSAFDLSPALFVENKGQWDEAVRYGFDGRGVRVSFTDSGPVFQMLKASGDKEAPETAQAVFTATFAGARQVRPTALERSSTQVNYYMGNDPSKWQSDVPSYKKIIYKGLYDGIDLYTWGKRSGLKYEFHVAPGADWRRVAVRYDGIDSLRIDEKGALHVKTALGEMVDEAPVVYQETAGGRREIASRFRLIDERSYGFEISGPVDARVPLVLDPCLAWGSYLGGSFDDYGYGIACDSTGNAWVTGETWSFDFPVPGGFSASKSGPWDVFVAKITPSGSLAWASFLGGASQNAGLGIACDSTGNAWVTGYTYSTDFPTPGGFSTSNSGGEDVFVARVTPEGTLAWASYLGGSLQDGGRGIACDSTGNAWVTGQTWSANFPVPGGFGTSNGGGEDAFVARITPSGTLAWASYLGASNDEGSCGITCDSTGNAWVAGSTSSADFPVPGGFSTNYNGSIDAFAARITPGGTLAWASYLGGSGQDEGLGIACDSTGNAWVTGNTSSADFPVPGGFSTSQSGSMDVFVARITPSGALAWGSYLGGSLEDDSYGIACDNAENVWVTGATQSTDFPVPGGFSTSENGVEDAFVARITPSATLAWASYLGGNLLDIGFGIACDRTGNMWVTGETGSTDFPAPGGFSGSNIGDHDAFVVRISVPRVTTTSLAGGTVGMAYSQTLDAAGGTPPYSWGIASGSLPAGLSLSAAGVISGTPTATGTSAFSVQVTDSQMPGDTATKALGIAISAAPGPTYQYAASDSETSTTSTAYVGKTSLTFTPPAADDWIIFGFCEFKSPNVNYATFVQLFVDGVGEGQNTRKPVDPTDYMPFISVKVKNLTAAAHTIQLMYRASNSAAAAYVRSARICAVRKASLEFYNVAQDSGVPLTSSLADVITLDWTASATGNYLVISTAEINATAAVSTDVETFYNGTLNDEGIIRAADNNDFTTFMSFNYLANAPAGVAITHKIAAKKVSSDATNHYIRRARILALRLTGSRFRYAAIASANEQNTTQTSFQQALTFTWTFGADGKWLFLNSARLSNSSTSYQTEVRVQLNNSATCGDQLMKPKHATDLLNYSSIDIRNLTTPRTVDMDYRTTNSAGTAKVKRLRFYGLPLDEQ